MSAAEWRSSCLRVAGVAAAVVGQLAVPEPPHTTGTVRWCLDVGRRQVHAHNVGGQEIVLAYAVAQVTSTAAAFQPLPPHTSYNATEDLGAFREGLVTVAPTLPAAGVAGLDRAIVFAIRALPLGITVHTVPGMDVTVVRDERTRLFRLTISSPTQPMEARVQASGAGGTVSVTAMLGGTSHEPTQHEVELPPGVDLSPVLRRFLVELLVPLSVYERATAERRGAVRNGLPEPGAAPVPVPAPAP